MCATTLSSEEEDDELLVVVAENGMAGVTIVLDSPREWF